ncbi:GTPase domain-containing protein [Desulfohalobiaceae bacterium Ax17]|uniref:GTP-binding protein n=1 Tax=Desulfovulcanus ferrireducens TaxID=2831190 RepID=UPI00207BCD3A|nr:GTPase domain-containing protein [Desulfovulcanus ferrireducens]MBT8763740.1 GTPase domain-containing protein [Desulfovulcanus ferrireducens]
MAIINLREGIIQVKIVYYGPGRSGKTTNLIYTYNKLKERIKNKLSSKLITINTKGERTLFFDFFPIGLGKIKGLDLKLQLYTTPGQIIYNSTRKLVLKGVDGIVFVADSLSSRREANIESFKNLQENLSYYNLSLSDVAMVFQWNKRDLAEEGIPILDIEVLEKDLNSELNLPSFPASALHGDNVFKTLNIAAKITVKSVIRKLLGSNGDEKMAIGG